MVKNTPLNALYCDSAASMPILPEVRNELQQILCNPLSLSWGVNLSSDHAIARYFQEQYEAHTAAFFLSVKCVPAEWFWTSGATESNEWALQIACDSCPSATILAVHPLAHASLSLSAKRIAEKRNLEYILLPLKNDGSFHIDFESFDRNYPLRQCIVAIPYGDHEIGVIDPNIRAFKDCSWLHFDAAQSFAKVTGDFLSWPCTSLACSSAKIGSLPGLGGLFVRLRPKKIMNPIFLGGSQQNALRAGTLPYLSIITFCIAYKAWQMESYGQKIQKLRQRIENRLRESSHVRILSSPLGLPHISTFELSETKKEAIIALKSLLAFSQGSACQKGQGSPALQAIGFALNRQRLLLRLGFSPYNLTEFEEIFTTLSLQLGL